MASCHSSFFSLSARTFSRVQETGQRWRERNSRLGNWELRCACFTSSFSPWLIFDEKFSVSHYSCIHRLAPSIRFFTLFAVEWSLQFFPCSPYFFTQKIVLSLCCWGYFNFAQMENNNQGKIIKWTQARKVQEIGKWVWGLTGRPRMSAKWGWQRARGPQYPVALFRVILNKAHCT